MKPRPRTSNPLPPAVRAFFAEKGREGGLLRGKRLSPERRRAIAKRAAQARWKQKRPSPYAYPQNAAASILVRVRGL